MKNNLKTISFAIFLIFFGFVALLVTYNYVTIENIFYLFFRFWPVLVIFGGIKLIVGAFKYGEYFNLILDVIFNVIICFALLFYTQIDDRLKEGVFFKYNDANIMKNIETGDLSVNTDSFAKEKVKSVDYNFKIGASKFTLYNGGEDTYYLHTSGKYNSRWFEPVLNKSFQEDNLKLSFSQRSPKPMVIGMGMWDMQTTEFNFLIGMSDINSTLDIDLGAGEGDVNLVTPIERVKANVGAGELKMELGNVKGNIDISVGAGNVVLILPKETKYLLDYNVGAGNVRVLNSDVLVDEFGGLAAKGEYGDKTGEAITIKVNVGAGNVDVVSK